MERKDYERYVTSLIMIEADNSFIVWHLQCKQNILGPKLPRRKTVFIFFSELYSYKIAGQQKKIINPGPISFHLSFWSAKKTIIKIITNVVEIEFTNTKINQNLGKSWKIASRKPWHFEMVSDLRVESSHLYF